MAGSAPATGRIFISYRREESAYPAAWLFDRLSDTFGTEQVFKDVDSMEPGDDFVAVITSAVESCDVLLALIGDRWLTVTDHDGKRRLDNPDDFVRLEIEAALTRGVRVIPILVEGARMPRPDQLPPSLAKLVRRHALELSPSGFHFETSRLLRVLNKALESAAKASDIAPRPERAAIVAPGSKKPDASGGDPVAAEALRQPATQAETAPAPSGSAYVTPSQPSGPPDDDHDQAPAQWAPDPFRAHELRYWDGTRWTEHVSDGGALGTHPPAWGGRPGPKVDARHQPLPGPGDPPQPFPAGAAAIYFPDGGAIPGAAVMPDRYGSVRELLDDLYESYLRDRFPPRSYGRVWVVSGTSRCIVPMAWLGDVESPIGEGDDDWHRLSPDQAGVRGNQAYRLFHPAEHRYCGVIVDDLSVLRSIETRDDLFFDRRAGRPSPFKAPLFQQLMQHRSYFPPSEVRDVPARFLGVFMCGFPHTFGKVLDLRGPKTLQMVQILTAGD